MTFLKHSLQYVARVQIPSNQASFSAPLHQLKLPNLSNFTHRKVGLLPLEHAPERLPDGWEVQRQHSCFLLLPVTSDDGHWANRVFLLNKTEVVILFYVCYSSVLGYEWNVNFNTYSSNSALTLMTEKLVKTTLNKQITSIKSSSHYLPYLCEMEI